MRANSIINRYVFKEMLPPFSITLFFFTFIFLMTQILEITNLIVNFRVDLAAVLLMLIYSMPFFLEFIIPMSVMMAVLLTFLRMSGDNETVALKAAGMSPYRFVAPVLLFCLMGCLLTGIVAIYGMPWGKRSFSSLALEVAETSISAGIKERTFNDNFSGIMLYVSKVDIKTKDLIDVFVEEEKSENLVSTVTAPRGRLFGDSGEHTFHLRLFDGMINQVNLKNRTSNTIRFDTYEINLDLKQEMGQAIAKRKAIEEMGIAELYRHIQGLEKKDVRYYSALMKFHEKFSIPFACFALGFLAIPLGMQSKTDRRSMGIVMGLILFLSYYVLLSMGWSFGESGAYPPFLGMWMPNVVSGGIGIFLFVRVAQDRPIQFGWIAYYLKKCWPQKKHDNTNSIPG